MVWKGDATGRLAKSLITLIDQVDARWPNRSRVSDGSIGDRSHAARVSDHNMGADGVVEAIDITHDSDSNGPDTWKLAETFRLNRDDRIDYVISNGRIFAGPNGPSPWVWRKYSGTNSHAQHVHVSVNPNQPVYDQPQPWRLDPPTAAAITPAPAPPKPPGITNDMRLRMVKVMLDYEFSGTLAGGNVRMHVIDGQPEIGGVTQISHPAAFARLKGILDRGDQPTLKNELYKFYLEYTGQVQNWTDRAGVEFMLRDCYLNRGPTGAAEILQMALGFTGADLDHQVGPTTRGALSALDPNVAIDKLRSARELYEDKHFDNGNGKRWRIARGQWDGLVNRWNNAQAQAKAFQREQGYTPIKSPEGAAGTAVIIVGGGAVAAAKEDPWTGIEVAMAVFSIAVAAFVAFMIVRSIRRKT